MLSLRDQIKKPLTHISPSTFLIADKCELAVFFLKLLGLDVPRPQTIQMAVGSAFDTFVKAEIAHKLGKSVKFAHLIDNVGIPAAIPIGKELCEKYVEQGCLDRLLEDGLSDIEFSYKQVDRFGVTMYGILDAQATERPIDFKVNGYGSNYGARPKIGYCRRISNGMNLGDYSMVSRDSIPGCFGSSIPMEEIDRDWATQLAFYWWMINEEQSDEAHTPVTGQIEQVCIAPGKLEFLTYKTSMSMTFIIELKLKIKSFWDRINKGELHEPTPNAFVCEPYKNPRPCTAFCPFYKTWKEGANPENQSVLDRLSNF